MYSGKASAQLVALDARRAVEIETIVLLAILLHFEPRQVWTLVTVQTSTTTMAWTLYACHAIILVSIVLTEIQLAVWSAPQSPSDDLT